MKLHSLLIFCAAVGATTANAQYSFRVVAQGLDTPVGITARGGGPFVQIYYLQNPTPGIPGSMGGRNSVRRLNLLSGNIDVLHEGEPDPINLALDVRGALYWTCRSAGVILRRSPSGIIAPILTQLTRPSGIAVARGDVYFTLVPTPAIPGSMGGTNSVNTFSGGVTSMLNMGEPEPVDIAVDEDGTAYWTCKSAGVILRRTPDGTINPYLTMLNKPVGISINSKMRQLWFTEVPTPGLPGSMGGQNKVRMINLRTGLLSTVHEGDPEPTDIAALPDGRVYWTCTSAGVIVEARRTP